MFLSSTCRWLLKVALWAQLQCNSLSLHLSWVLDWCSRETHVTVKLGKQCWPRKDVDLIMRIRTSSFYFILFAAVSKINIFPNWFYSYSDPANQKGCVERKFTCRLDSFLIESSLGLMLITHWYESQVIKTEIQVLILCSYCSSLSSRWMACMF